MIDIPTGKVRLCFTVEFRSGDARSVSVLVDAPDWRALAHLPAATQEELSDDAIKELLARDHERTRARLNFIRPLFNAALTDIGRGV